MESVQAGLEQVERDRFDALISAALHLAAIEVRLHPVRDVVNANGCWCRRLANGQLEPLLRQPSPPAVAGD